MPFRKPQSLRSGIFWLLCLGLLWSVQSPLSWAQAELTRKVKSRVDPVYPELARKMSISGTVRMEVIVTPAGTVKETKILGGHPVLVGAATEAVRKWRFEPGPEESSGTIEFKFSPQD